MIGNLLTGLPDASAAEVFEDIFSRDGVRIERIVSCGQATAPGDWYDQPWAEFVLLIAGHASLRFADEAEPHLLAVGDYVLIDAHRRHRVESTALNMDTVWLAIHFGEQGSIFLPRNGQ